MSSINIFMHASPDENLCILPGFCYTCTNISGLAVEWTPSSMSLGAGNVICFFVLFLHLKTLWRTRWKKNRKYSTENRRQKTPKPTEGISSQSFLHFHMCIASVEGARPFLLDTRTFGQLYCIFDCHCRCVVDSNKTRRCNCDLPCGHFHVNITVRWAAGRVKCDQAILCAW